MNNKVRLNKINIMGFIDEMKKPMKKKKRHTQTHTLQGLLPIPKKSPILKLKFIIDRPLFLITIYYRTYSRYPTLLQAL